MPQELTSEWEVELGDQAQEVHQRLLHTIGNLTLTAYNRELSNKPFDEKKKILAKSNFALNESLTTYGTWDADSIGSRANALADTVHYAQSLRFDLNSRGTATDKR